MYVHDELERLLKILATQPEEKGGQARSPLAVFEARKFASAHAIFGAFPTEPWLREAYTNSAQVRPLERVAALGLVGRLWAPPWGEASSRVDAHDELPPLRVASWARGNAYALSALEPLALEKAEVLTSEVQELITYLPNEGVLRPDVLLRVARRRDDLESVAWVLHQAKLGRDLEAELARTDREALAQATLIQAELQVDDSPRFEAVGREEPDAWWGWVGA